MAFKPTASARQLRPDPRYNDLVLAKFINCVMERGQKSSAQRIMYDAFDIIEQKLSKETSPEAPKAAIEVFQKAIENVKPFVEVRSKRVGGANYQVPIPVKQKRQQKHGVRAYTRCNRCGRPRAVFRRYKLCRICLRDLAHEGAIPGMTKSSW